MMWRDSGVPADSFYEARTECAEGPKSKFKIKAGKTLSARRWHAAFNPEGCLDIASVLSRIQRGYFYAVQLKRSHLSCRVQYARWKEVCQELDSHVGSGRIITAPVITEDGQPIHDPLVLQEANPDHVPSSREQGSESNVCLDKPIIEWKLTLHQIGMK
ncbi:hypothetical protein BHE74_00019498 [Ensete ventricosum]|uniref:Uncharacterized protein n=1 Tax=Ensete ventricosum TaxID=4639 RepID=A0A444EJ79_ENSVE|nr:hypothetical protein B296_00026388 [Ensete ventricosum]RWW10481.1 hypothetical protein GW17_00025978 [Ensete ventricosum]RWW72681.1 hypothetical protein BHE74_00019498 [Ensete ventricosum]RZR98008.1 hypothetical protein BHM03_00027302 [Ensete ventricosum]